MRVVVCAHDQVPHEPAAPLSMCGLPLGSPRTASTGAHVNRYFQEREPDSGTPHAVVLDSVLPASADYWSFATRTGLHPASSRPLLLRLGGVVDLVDQLARTGVGDRRAAVDGLRSALASQLEGRMVDATGAPLRSAAVAAHRHAIVGLAGADALANVLTPEMLEPRLSAACDGPLALDIFGAGLSAAVGMLTHPTSPARYAAVIDHGLTPTNDNVSLDGHDRHLELHARNLPHTLRSVMDRLNEPGEGDPTKLDLDDTVVAFTTEFGRTPHGQPDSDQGTDHHPYGFVQVLIGGPVAPGIVGALGPDGIAVDPVTPRRAAGGPAREPRHVALHRRLVLGGRRPRRHLRPRRLPTRGRPGAGGDGVIALLLGCGRDPAAPPPGPSAALDPIGTPAPPTTLEVCDAGDDSFVARAAVLALGRRLRGTDELARWRAQARGQGREQMVRAMLAEPGAREAWATWLADAMHVARAGDQDLQDCWGRAALPGQGGALTSFLRASGPELAYPGGAFSMADVVADALAADDVSVVFRLHLLVRQVAPPPLPSEDPMVLETFYRTQLGLTFLSRYLDRDLSCIRCHNGEFSVTDTTWPLPGHAEQALFGDSAGPASEEALTSLFSHTDLVVDPAIEPDVPTVRPWGLDPSCGVFVDPSSWPDEPDWLGQEERYFVQELGPRGSVWDLERSLHAGVDGVRGAGPRIGPDGHMDGDEAFAWLVAVHLADQVWASAVGAPLTIANGFPRNAAQRDLLERLSSALVERWSLADLVVAVTAEPAFNPGMGCGADPYGLPALFDPWTDADLDPARRGERARRPRPPAARSRRPALGARRPRVAPAAGVDPVAGRGPAPVLDRDVRQRPAAVVRGPRPADVPRVRGRVRPVCLPVRARARLGLRGSRGRRGAGGVHARGRRRARARPPAARWPPRRRRAPVARGPGRCPQRHRRRGRPRPRGRPAGLLRRAAAVAAVLARHRARPVS
jgi:hypothetical protein